MNVYIFKAAWLCEKCGTLARQVAYDAGDASLDVSNEHTYDSDKYPKGPYPAGGGEADCPQHCDHCSLFLENPLTEEHDLQRWGVSAGNTASPADSRRR